MVFKPLRRCFGLIFHSAPTASTVTCICYFLECTFPAILTWSISGILDTVTSHLSASFCYPYFFLLLAAFLIICIARFILAITLNAGVFEKSNAFCKLKAAEKSASLDLIEFENANMLNIQRGALECIDDEVFGTTFMLLVKGISSLFSLFLISIVLWTYHPALVAVAIISVIPFFLVRLIRGKAMFRLKKAQIPELRKSNYFYSLFMNRTSTREIKQFNAWDFFRGKWKNSFALSTEQRMHARNKDAKIIMICELLTVMFLAVAVALSIYLNLHGEISAGIMGGCLIAFQSMQNATKALFSDIGTLPELTGSLQNYFQFLDFGRSTESKSKSPVAPEDRIEVENVSFRYPNAEKDALSGISLSISKGETLAIVGENGSGKTTLTKLLLGLYNPTAGHVFWDGMDLNTLSLDSILKQTAVVMQSPNQWKLPLSESITFSSTLPGQDDGIRNILHQVNFPVSEDADISAVRLGAEFGGLDLSGGEWQRLSLARCLYKDAPVCILDEPTSALDPMAEIEILRKFIEISKDKTSVIVTHRVGICRYADKILVLKHGKMVQYGTHDQLIAADGEYQAMYEDQRQWYVK